MTNIVASTPPPSQQLLYSTASDLSAVADVIAQGAAIVAAFNGVYGIFCDADNPAAVAQVMSIKGRPKQKGLVLVAPPEYLPDFIDDQGTPYPLASLQLAYLKSHSLGCILPACGTAPEALVKDGTILVMWTEYYPHMPFRQLYYHLRVRGLRALAGTSANRSGLPSHTDSTQVTVDFHEDVAAFVLDDFTDLPATRRKSTSIVDMTGPRPRLHREGSLPQAELDQVLSACGIAVTEAIAATLYLA